MPRARRDLLLHLFVGLVALGLLLWAFTGQGLRNSQGDLTSRICVPIAAAIALLALIPTAGTKWAESARWFVIALMGQAVSLQLIDAGNNVRYQHYQPFPLLLTQNHPVLLLFILIQTVLVAAGIKRHSAAIRDWLRCNFKPWQLLCIAAFFFVSSATVSRKISGYVIELFFASFIQTVNLGNIILLAWALPQGILRNLDKKFRSTFRARDNEAIHVARPRIDRFALLAALWITALSAMLSCFAYERHPHITDEVIYCKHAEYLAEGRLTSPPPPVPQAFEVYLMQVQGQRYFPVPPMGWPAILSLGVLLNVPWLVNPVLAGLNVILTYLLLQRICSPRLARISILLLCFSPWYAFMGMNFMTHMSTLTLALCAALAVEKARNSTRAVWGWLAGVSVGAMSLIRPLEGLIIALLLGLWSVGLGGKRLKISAITGLVIGSIIVGSAVFFYNNYLTGDPMVFPLNAYTDEKFGPNANALGFGPDRGMGWAIDPYPGHSPLDALINANLNTFAINIELFGWSTGSLLLAALFLFSGKLRRPDFLMIAVIIAVFVPHFFYYFSGGPDFGARYWFLMIIPFVVLSVRGMEALEKKIENETRNSGFAAARVKAGVLSLCFLALVNFFPWRAADKYHNYRSMRPDIRELAAEHDFGRSLVLVKGDAVDYPSAWFHNPVDFRADVPIYAWDRNPTVRKQLLNAYPDRTIWIISGPSVTGSGFEVVAGPIQPGSL
jgi:hypothetical protein